MAWSPRHRRVLWLILLVYLGLAALYALSTPPLEASDEYKHYPVVQFVQTTGRLPVLDPADPGRWLQEAAQPPLYYGLMALITAGIDTSDLPAVHRLNPHAFIGMPDQVTNKNLILHDPAREAFPWRGTVLAVYVIRAASILLGLCTLLVTAALGRRLVAPDTALLASALVAFNPMFLFVHAAVNNDSLAILLGHLGLLLLLRLWQVPPDPRRQWARYVALGLVLGAGVLTKLSLGGLGLLAGLALAVAAVRRRRWRLLLAGGGLLAGSALLVCGWWFWRNWQLYGDLTALNVFVAVQGTRQEPLTWAGWLDEAGTFYRAFWGLFGGVNVAAPQLYYAFMNGLAVVGLAGLARARQWRARQWRARLAAGGWLLPAWALLLLLLLLRWNLISPAFQGRLLFPALGAIMLPLAAGLLAWLPPGWRAWGGSLLAAGLAMAALALPWLSIRPAYARPRPLAAAPPAARFGPVTFTAPDGRIRLVGVEMAPGQETTPGGQPVVVTLYWQAATPVTADYVSSVHLLGRDFRSEGQINRYPAGGMIPTSRWRAGDLYRDVYHVVPGAGARAPAQLRVAVSLFDPGQGRDLPATLAGAAVDPLLVGPPVRLAAPADLPPPRPEVDLAIPFAAGITLAGAGWAQPATPGATAPLTLTWRATGTPDQDYTVFVQLLAPDGAWLAGADAPPMDGFFPTSLWRAGDWIEDTHRLSLPADLPPGEYPVAVGLYDPATGRRLQRQDGGGDAVRLTLTVSR